MDESHIIIDGNTVTITYVGDNEEPVVVQIPDRALYERVAEVRGFKNLADFIVYGFFDHMLFCAIQINDTDGVRTLSDYMNERWPNVDRAA